MSTLLQNQAKATATSNPSVVAAPMGLLQRKCACGGSAGVDGECAECRAKRLSLQRHITPLALQTKLTVNKPGDRYEQEADQAADQVMRMPVSEHASAIPARVQGNHIQHLTPLHQDIHRQSGLKEEKEEKVKEDLQAKETAGQSPAVTPALQGRIVSLRGEGQPIPGHIRSFMEPRFGHDFSRVRIHSDTRAAETARAVHARAYTLGKDIVFGAGEYAPGTITGKRLLAHELTHVIQQGSAISGTLQRKPLTTEEKKQNLKSPRFAANTRLQRAFDDSPALAEGETDRAVEILQQALIDLGYDMPISTRKQGLPDGIFGEETRKIVLQFQRDYHLTMLDGIVGRETLGKLDELFSGEKPSPGPKPEPPTSATVTLKSINFKSSHHPMRDNKADLEKSGSFFPKPEWESSNPNGKSAPFSHSMNKNIDIDIEYDVSSDVTSEVPFILKGQSGEKFLSFTTSQNLKAGKGQTLSMTSEGQTPSQIVALLNRTIDWSAVLPDGRQSVGRSIGHDVFVTMDNPREPDEVTYKRMARAVELAGTIRTLVPQELVRGIMKNFGAYNLHIIYSNPWKLATNETTLRAGAQCIDIVRFVMALIGTIGCPGIAEAKLIWADPTDPATALESPSSGPSLDKHPPHPNHPSWFAYLIDANACANNFEAALKFTQGGVQYYPGGVPLEDRAGNKIEYKNPTDVLFIFQYLVWLEFLGDNNNYMVQEFLKSYSGRRIAPTPHRLRCGSNGTLP